MSTQSLLISVTFLQPTCHARLGQEERAPNEWPPSPLRLLQAMVAGAAARWSGQHAADGSLASTLSSPAPIAAFRWLERLCESVAPTIFAPKATTGAPVPHFVPNNSGDLLLAKWASGQHLATFDDRTAKFFRPSYLQDGRTVHYLWPLQSNDVALASELGVHLPTLTAAARCIVALGWGIDVAIGDAGLIDEKAQSAFALSRDPDDGTELVRWSPTPAAGSGPSLRVPCAGTFDDLNARHHAFRRRLEGGVFRPTPPLRVFNRVHYSASLAPSERPFAAFALRWAIDPAVAEQDNDAGREERRLDGRRRAFRFAHVARLASMLRHLACEAAWQDSGHSFPGGAQRFVAGHVGTDSAARRGDTPPRFSYLPIPSFTGPRPDGMIRRMIVAEPFGGTGAHAAWAARALHGRVLVGSLRDGEPALPLAMLERIDQWADDEVLPRCVGLRRAGSDRWESVTPVVLPGYDGHDSRKAVKLLSKACDQAGLPCGSVESFEFTAPPRWAEDAARTRVGVSGGLFAPKYLRGLPLRHVRVKFREPVRGPIVIGAGRHCGLGVLGIASPG